MCNQQKSLKLRRSTHNDKGQLLMINLFITEGKKAKTYLAITENDDNIRSSASVPWEKSSRVDTFWTNTAGFQRCGISLERSGRLKIHHHLHLIKTVWDLPHGENDNNKTIAW